MKETSHFRSEPIKHQTSGGFKYPLETLTKHVQLKNTSTISTKTQRSTTTSKPISKQDIFNEIGLDPNTKDSDLPIDFGELQEEGIYGLKSKTEIADVLIKDLEKKIEKIQIGRKGIKQKVIDKRKKQEEEAYKAQDVIIYEGDQRRQYASHILSTLEVHSIDNLEAIIKAHHKELESLESQYLSTKRPYYKNTGNYNKSYSTYSKYKTPYKFTQEFMPSQPMTREQYLENYHEYKSNKDYKKCHHNNNNALSLTQQRNNIPDPDFDRYQPTSPNQKRAKSPPKHRKKPESKEIEEPQSPSKLEKPLLKYFFQKISKEPSHKNPTKSEVLKFLIKNPRILELYGLNAEKLNQELNDYSNNGFMTLEEFCNFLKYSRKEGEDMPIENTCLLDNKELIIMKELFNEVDMHQDGVVSRALLTEKLRNDRRIAKKLEFQALYLPAIDKVLTLNQVFKQIEQEAIIAQGTKNYISWQQFERYFMEHKVKDQALLAKLRILKAKTLLTRTENDENMMDLDRILKQFLKDMFDITTKKKDSKGNYTGFVKTFDLLERIRGHHNFWKFSKEIVRKKSENHNLKEENLEELLIRLDNEGPEYITWNDFIDYFTRKGRPNFIAKKEKAELNKFEELFMPPNIEDYEEEYQINANLRLKTSSPRHSIDSPYNLKSRKKLYF